LLLYSFEDKVKHYKVWSDMTGRLTADNEQHFWGSCRIGGG